MWLQWEVRGMKKVVWTHSLVIKGILTWHFQWKQCRISKSSVHVTNIWLMWLIAWIFNFWREITRGGPYNIFLMFCSKTCTASLLVWEKNLVTFRALKTCLCTYFHHFTKIRNQKYQLVGKSEKSWKICSKTLSCERAPKTALRNTFAKVTHMQVVSKGGHFTKH